MVTLVVVINLRRPHPHRKFLSARQSGTTIASEVTMDVAPLLFPLPPSDDDAQARPGRRGELSWDVLLQRNVHWPGIVLLFVLGYGHGPVWPHMLDFIF